MKARRPLRGLLTLLIGLSILAGCSSSPKKSRSGKSTSAVVSKRGGGYYKDDGPGSGPAPDITRIPNAVPRLEPLARANARPYTVLGKSFVPFSEHRDFRQTGTASWYGRKFHGNKTANGETYDMYAMTAAHPTLPLPSYARVSRPGTDQYVIVRINDRGPFHSSRIIDLSYVAAAKLGLIGPGSGTVVVEAITPTQIQAGQFEGNSSGGIANAPPATQSAGHNTGFKAAAKPAPEPDQHGLEALIASSSLDESMDSSPSWNSNPQDQQLVIAPSSNSTSGSHPGIYLQFGAFSAHQNASSLAAQLNRKIGQIEVRNAQVEAVNALYRVQIGPYHSRTEAVNAAHRIQQQTGMNASLAVR